MDKSSEVEKPFKCDSCTHRFSNEDHLQVHKKKHEMSLSFKGEVALGFVDETPTPSKGCGLFDDIPINPFDFALLSEVQTPSGPSTSYRSQSSFNSGSLETPQISLPTPFVPLLPNQKTPPISPQIPKLISTNEEPNLNLNSNNEINERNSILIKNGSQEKNPENLPKPSIFKRNKSVIEYVEKQQTKVKKCNLKLHLSPVSSNNEESPASSSKSSLNEFSGHEVKKKKEENRKDLLARNRAAAVRSRQRKKQWVDGLERKCETLERLLRETQTELKLAKEETINMRMKHLNCDVTREDLKCGIAIFPPLFEGVIGISPVVVASSDIPPTPQRGKRGRPANNSRNIPPIPPTTQNSTPKIPISNQRNFKVQILTVPPQMIILDDDGDNGKTNQILTQNPK